MKRVEAFLSDDGGLFLEEIAAKRADERHAYNKRVDTFIKESPAYYEGARDLEGWLKSDKGYQAVLRLVGVI